MFRDANHHVLEPTGGLNARDATGVEFEALNHKYGLKGKNRVTTWREALWQALPAGGPFCLDRIDLEALNDLPQAQRHGGFRLPDFAHEADADEREAEYRAGQAPVTKRGRPLTPQQAKFQAVAKECHAALRSCGLPEAGDFGKCMKDGLAGKRKRRAGEDTPF